MNESEVLKIFTLGDLRILRNEKLMKSIRSRKAQAMMVYLACTSKPHAREVLADIFWSESSPSQAMSNLRDVIHILRKHLSPFVDITRYSIALNPETDVWIDVAELDNTLMSIHEGEETITIETAIKIEEALELYQRDFLEGFYIRAAQGFEEWLVVERERIRLATLDALLLLVKHLANEANYRKGIHYARRIIELEPLMETGYRHLMRMLASSGRTSEALIQYKACRNVLQKELGVEPSEEAKEIYERLLKGEELPGAHTGRPRHNLRMPSSKLIGRDEELSQVAGFLEDPACRLLTLIGVGGIGKSSLSLHAAVAAIDHYPDGVWLVELAAFNEVEILPDKIASEFGVTAQEAQAGVVVTDVLVDYLKDKSLLLVLDNCEHLIEACASFSEVLLNGCPKVKILATSREAFGIREERTFQVSPLALPPQGAPLETLEKYPAIQLFLERAATARPRFGLTEDNNAVLVEICWQLEGIPLAIELAAARVKVISLNQIARRLQDRFRLLTGGPRTALPRHQTLQATMDWSYGLLSELERCLLRRLSVFSGGWKLEAAEEVASFGDLEKKDVLDLLAQLVDKSLALVEEQRGRVRYGMLETVRQYGVRMLREEEEGEEARRRHAAFYIQLAEQADKGLRDIRQNESLDLLDAEHDNLRAALRWATDSGAADMAFRLVGALGWFWFMRGHWKESWQWLKKTLDLGSSPNSVLRAKAIYRAGGLQLIRGNLVGPVELVEEALAICRAMADEEGIAWCLNLLGQAHTWDIKTVEEGVPLLLESIEIFDSLQDDWGKAWSLRYLGQITETLGKYKQGIRLQKEALASFERLGDIWNVAHSLYLLGLSAYEHSDFELAKWSHEECLVKCGLVEDKVMEAHALNGLAQLALYEGDLDYAERLFREALEALQKIGDVNCASRSMRELAEVARRRDDFEQARLLLAQSLRNHEMLRGKNNIAWSIFRFAALADSLGRRERVVLLLGAADFHFGGKDNLPPTLKGEVETLMDSTQKHLDDRVFAQLFEEGAAMSLQDAVAYALEEINED
jgi:predicted ATPase/DNA-binding SARP family transcriptional activator